MRDVRSKIGPGDGVLGQAGPGRVVCRSGVERRLPMKDVFHHETEQDEEFEHVAMISGFMSGYTCVNGAYCCKFCGAMMLFVARKRNGCKTLTRPPNPTSPTSPTPAVVVEQKLPPKGTLRYPNLKHHCGKAAPPRFPASPQP